MRHANSLVVLVVVLVVSFPARADYALGLVAFDRGDIATAHREFSALAEEGHPAAQYSLAMLYLKSDPPEYSRAVPWLEKSARRGLPESQYMLGMLSLYGVGMAKDTKQGMRWLTLASGQDNEDAQALLDQLKQARLREAESTRRKAEQARDLRTELARATATEQSLQKRLSKSRQREKSLASERKTLEKARASDARAKETMRREQARLEAELEALRFRLAEADRAREAQSRAKDDVVVAEAVPVETVVEDAPGEAVVAGKVVEILPDGVLLTEVSRRAQGRSEPFPEGFVVFLSLAATDGLSEGQQVAYPAEPATPYRYKYASGATGRIRAYRVVE
jgi:hypothetical protein